VTVDFPSIDLKSIELPELKSIELPELKAIEIPDLKSIEIPDIPSVNLLGDLPLPVIGLGIAAIALLVAATRGEGGERLSSSTRQRGGTSLTTIPYEAPAQMAYGEWIANHENEKVNAAAYAHFKKMYEAKAVADATSKKLARDLANFKNEPPPKIERQIKAPEKTENLDPLYFAGK